MHAASEEQWNAPWMFDETLGAGSANAKVPLAGVSEEKAAQMTEWQLFQYHTRSFLLRNAYVPLLCRAVNVMLLASTLAVGVVLRRKLRAVGEEVAVGVSPLLAIIFSPPSMAHAILQIWFEYFSLPIGLWKLSSKLWYTVLELVFVCLWSAELALAMDNYFTSTIVCTASNSPFYFIREDARTRLEHKGDKDTVCDLQVALICLTFVSVIVYLVVFMISLLRIFYRIRT